MTNEEKAAKNLEYMRRWRAKNPDKEKELKKRYYQKHREERLIYFKTRHREIMEKAKKYDELMRSGIA